MIQRLRAELGEHFRDYVLVARSQTNHLFLAMSDRTWSRAALEDILEELSGSTKPESDG